MTFSKLNEMIQSNRDKSEIVQALLKSLLLLTSGDQGLELDLNESAGDILSLITATIA